MREGLRRSDPEQNQTVRRRPCGWNRSGVSWTLWADADNDAHEVLAMLVEHADIMRPGELAGLTAGDLRYVPVAGAGAPVGGHHPSRTSNTFGRP